jgi:hypothetical protein
MNQRQFQGGCGTLWLIADAHYVRHLRHTNR